MALTGDFDAADTDRLWEEVGMTNHPANGDAIEAWDDEGDAADNALFADGGGPLWIANGIHGLGAIRFNGTSQTMKAYNDAHVLQRAVSTFAAVSAYTVMVAFIMEADATNNANPEDNTGILSENFKCWGLNVTSNAGVHTAYWIHRIAFAVGGVKSVSQTFQRDQSTVVLARFDGTDIFIAVNRNAESSFTTGGNVIDLSATLFVAVGSSEEFPGLIGQIRLWDTADADGNLAAEWAAFQLKWLGASSTFPALTVAI